MHRWLAVFFVVLMSLPVLAQDPAPTPTAPERLVSKIINTYPHDTTSFTQGLIFFDGKLYESAGLYGESDLREVDIKTGEVLRSVPLRRSEADLAAGQRDYFGEGIERIGDKIIQLTWTDGQAFVYDLSTFKVVDTLTYTGEGWGMCSDGRHLYQSDSTNYLVLRDLDSFDMIVRFLVTFNGQPLAPNLLNELECVDASVYANLWQTDFIVRIDKMNGTITAVIDASSLLTAEERAALDSSQVLNGIAYNPETKTFFITGKQWPKLFEVQFVAAPPATK